MVACCMCPDTNIAWTPYKQNLHLLDEFVECMANNGVDVCGQVGSNWGMPVVSGSRECAISAND